MENNRFVDAAQETEAVTNMTDTEEYQAMKAVARDEVSQITALTRRIMPLTGEALDREVDAFVRQARQPVNSAQRAAAPLGQLKRLAERELERREGDDDPTLRMSEKREGALTRLLAEIFVDAQFAGLPPEEQPSLLEHFALREELEQNPDFLAARDYYSRHPQELKMLVDAAERGLNPEDMSRRLQEAAARGQRERLYAAPAAFSQSGYHAYVLIAAVGSPRFPCFAYAASRAADKNNIDPSSLLAPPMIRIFASRYACFFPSTVLLLRRHFSSCSASCSMRFASAAIGG